MRNLEEARKEARAVLNEEYDITAGEIEELHNMNEWDKITTSFDLGVTAGAKSSAVPDEADLMELLDKLSLDKMVTVIEYMQKLLIESAAEKVTACPSCGSGELSKDGRFIVCDNCGAGGYFKVFEGGDVRLFWEKKGEPDHD